MRTLRLLVALTAVASLGGCVSSPPMARHLPYDIRGADSEFARRLKARFPDGSSSAQMIRALTAEGFRPTAAHSAGPSTHVYVYERDALICSFAWNVFWLTDEEDRVSDVSGTYDTICL